MWITFWVLKMEALLNNILKTHPENLPFIEYCKILNKHTFKIILNALLSSQEDKEGSRDESKGISRCQNWQLPQGHWLTSKRQEPLALMGERSLRPSQNRELKWRC